MSTVPNDTCSTADAIDAVAIPRQVQFGDLIIAFTNRYEYRWNDKRSGADEDVSFYHPICPEGFHALGSIAVGSYEDLGGKVASMCVKASKTTSGKAALKEPIGWQFIWSDKGSGATDDGACWRPIPPAGYVALGDVMVAGYDQPRGGQVMCVARELVHDGLVGDWIWDDDGSGVSRDFGCWQIGARDSLLDSTDGLFAPNTFVAVASHNKPAGAQVWTLRLPLPTFGGPAPEQPTLTSRSRPADRTAPLLDRSVIVPYTVVIDADKETAWRIENSPFYVVERISSYSLKVFLNNISDVEQEVSAAMTTGISREHSQTFSIATGITISQEAGVDAGGFSTKASVSLSVELGFSTTSTVSEFRSTTDEAILRAAPGHAGALWIEHKELNLRRADGSLVTRSLSFNSTGSSYHISQYPKQSEERVRPGVMAAIHQARLPSTASVE